jgi:flagellar hook-length control protein FliK
LSGDSSNGRITILDFVSSLKQVVEKVQAINPETGDQAAIHLNVDNLKNLALGATRHAAQQAAMERPTMSGENSGRPGEQADVPAEVNNAINRLIEKATASDQTDEGLTAIIKNSKIRFDDPASKKVNADDSVEDNKLSADASKEKLTAVKGEGKLSAVSSAEEIKPAVNPGSEPGLDNAIDPKTPFGKSMANAPDMPLDGAHTKNTAAAHGLDRTPQSTENTLPNHVIDQLGRQISRSLIRGDGIVQLRLKPAELGTVRLEMQMTDNHMNVTVAAENGAVKELLLANVQELREMLQAQGIRLEKLDVQVGDNFRQAFSDLSEEAAREHSSRQGESGKQSYTNDGGEQDTRFESRDPRHQDAIVDLVA